MLRFIILGAVGFGIGWAIPAVVSAIIPEAFFEWTFFFSGAVGGALLGLALGDWKRVATLTLAGFLGFGVGFYFSMVAVLLLGLLPSIEAGIGMVGGAALGLVFGDLKRVALLALAGFVGFGIGGGDCRSFAGAHGGSPRSRGSRTLAGPAVVGGHTVRRHRRSHRRGLPGSGPRIP